MRAFLLVTPGVPMQVAYQVREDGAKRPELRLVPGGAPAERPRLSERLRWLWHLRRWWTFDEMERRAGGRRGW